MEALKHHTAVRVVLIISMLMSNTLGNKSGSVPFVIHHVYRLGNLKLNWLDNSRVKQWNASPKSNCPVSAMTNTLVGQRPWSEPHIRAALH